MTTEIRPAFTPGPWAVSFAGDDAVARRGTPRIFGSGRYVAFVTRLEGRGDTNVNRDANARLIAAAPDLYEALQALIADEDAESGDCVLSCEGDRDRGDHSPGCALVAARAALAKADGR